MFPSFHQLPGEKEVEKKKLSLHNGSSLASVAIVITVSMDLFQKPRKKEF